MARAEQEKLDQLGDDSSSRLPGLEDACANLCSQKECADVFASRFSAGTDQLNKLLGTVVIVDSSRGPQDGAAQPPSGLQRQKEFRANELMNPASEIGGSAVNKSDSGKGDDAQRKANNPGDASPSTVADVASSKSAPKESPGENKDRNYWESIPVTDEHGHDVEALKPVQPGEAKPSAYPELATGVSKSAAGFRANELGIPVAQIGVDIAPAAAGVADGLLSGNAKSASLDAKPGPVVPVESTKSGQISEKVGGPRVKESSEKVKSPEELGNLWQEARKSNDFSKSNEALGKAVKDAYAKGGMDGVRQLEADVKKHIGAKGEGPIVVKEGKTLEIHNVQHLPQDKNYFRMPDRRRLGINRYEVHGWVKELGEQKKLSVAERPEKPYQVRELTGANQKLIDKLVVEHGSKLNDGDKKSLREGLTALMKGDVDGLKKTVPYADKGMSAEAGDAFTQALKSAGYTVASDGWAERGAAQYGSRIIAPPGGSEGLRLTVNHRPEDSPPTTYTAEAVQLDTSKLPRAHSQLDIVKSVSDNHDKVQKVLNQIYEHGNSKSNFGK